MGVWSETTPAGSDDLRDGDDRIRELKVALGEALSHESSTFPGATPGATPIFIPGFLYGATGARPTGDSLVTGRLFFNTTLGVIERYNGATWDVILTTPGAGSVTAAKMGALAVETAAINNLAVTEGKIGPDAVTGAKIGSDQIDSEHYVADSIDAEHLSHNLILPGEITKPSQPRFSARNTSIRSNVTGSGTSYTVPFDTEDVDIGSDFAANVFTAPRSGAYLFTVNVTIGDFLANHRAELFLVTSVRTYGREFWTTLGGVGVQTFSYTQIVGLGSTNTAYVVLKVSNSGADGVDVLVTTTTNSVATSFSGILLA